MMSFFGDCFRGACGVEQDDPAEEGPDQNVMVRITEEPKPGPSNGDGRRRDRGEGDIIIDQIAKLATIEEEPGDNPQQENPKPAQPVVTLEVDRAKENMQTIAEKIMTTCTKLNGKFFDEDFPVGPTALYKNGEKAEKEVKKGEQLDAVKMWLRPGKIIHRDEDGGHFGLDLTIIRDQMGCDVRQGELGDCWFISCLGLLSRRKELLDKIVVTKTVNAAGVYVIRLFHEGKFRDVLIDDQLPCNEYRSLCFRKANRMQLFAPLIEKASAKLAGSYEALIGGRLCDAMLSLTGVPSTDYDLKEDLSDDEKDGIWQILGESANSRFLIAAATKPEDKKMENLGLKPSHAYGVVKVCDKWGPRLILFENPWGTKVWKGDWHNYSWTWGVNMRKAYRPFMNKSGVFYMCFDDVVKYFVKFSICQLEENHPAE